MTDPQSELRPGPGAHPVLPPAFAAALRELVDAVRAGATGGDVAARYGPDLPSERRPQGLRVEPADGPFAALEIRPWSGRATGVVDAELRPGGAPVPVAALAAAVGPFTEMPGLDAGTPWLVRHLDGPGPRVRLLVAVGSGPDGLDLVEEIELIRDWPPPTEPGEAPAGAG